MRLSLPAGLRSILVQSRSTKFQTGAPAWHIFIWRSFRYSQRYCCRLMSSEPPAKVATMAKTVKIGTHNGAFHCDEVLACFMLRQLPEYKEAEIVRSRDPAVLAQCDIVVDVGGEYAPSQHRYDHHQKSFSGTMLSLAQLPFTTKLSSAGLVYLHFGHRILSSVLEIATDSPATERLYVQIYKQFIEEIDGNDNGVDAYDGPARYSTTTSLPSRVKRCNPNWNDPIKDETACFFKAYEMVGAEFLDRVRGYHKVWLPARTVVENSVKARHEVDSSGEILRLDMHCPWQQHLMEVEEELKIEPTIKFVLYHDGKESWRVQAVPQSLDSFETRVPLKKEWAALRGSDLSQASGIPECVFVHANLFIGGNKTYEGALAMARKSLEK